MNKNLSLKQVLVFFAIVLGFLIVIATLAYNRLVSLVESTDKLNKNNDFVLKLEEVISYLKDAETGTRGYLLTADVDFLKPQKNAGAKIINNLVDLRQQAMTVDEQIPYIDSIHRMAIAEIYHLWLVTESRKIREIKPLTNEQLSLIVQGKKIMDSIRITVQNLKVIETKRLNINIKEQKEFAESSPRYLLIIIISAITTIIITMWVIYRQLSVLNKAKRRLEEKLGELKKANRELDQYAFTLSHHLQEPLRKIQLFSSRYENKLKKVSAMFANNNITEGVIDFESIQKINGLAADSQELLNEFLAFADLNQKHKKDREQLDLSEILKTIWAEKKDMVAAAQAQYTLEGETEIVGYKEHIVILFEQLIDNALKFRHLERSAVIIVTNKRQQIEEKIYQIITFSDNGIGFEQEYAPKVFLIFQKLNHKKDYKGLGVGLAISRKIVELHNGTIWVESRPDIGSTFTIKIPLIRNIN